MRKFVISKIHLLYTIFSIDSQISKIYFLPQIDYHLTLLTFKFIYLSTTLYLLYC